jgi:nucleotide-binding universal stress UspA family protein
LDFVRIAGIRCAGPGIRRTLDSDPILLGKDEDRMNSTPGRVIVGVSGSLGSLVALHAAVAEARQRQSPLVAILAWVPTVGELSYRRVPCPEVLQLDEEDAARRLHDAFEESFGGPPPGLDLSAILVRGDPGPTLVNVADQPEDVLVVGASGHGWWQALRGSVARYCVSNASCPVLVVPPPALAEHLRRDRPVKRSAAGWDTGR